MPAVADDRFWNKIAEKYAAQPVADPDAFDRKIAVTRALMQPDHVVLDIGCGTGSLALRLADAGREVHGLDVSKEMIRIARDKAAGQGIANVGFHVGPFDGSFDAFGEGELDGICAYSILHLVPDLDDALALAFRLLKPGGYLVSSTVCLSWVYKPIIGTMRLFGKAPRVSCFSRETLEAAFARAGFVDVAFPDVGAKKPVVFATALKSLS